MQKQTSPHHTLAKSKETQGGTPKGVPFFDIKRILEKYLDTSERNYNLLACWILGTYFHSNFETYPLLLLTARKQCGKTRTLKLCSALCCGSDGSVGTSLTETGLFRHEGGSLFFDELESISSKEKGSLRELINAVYKRGNKIVRYREVRRKYVPEEFFPYYPLGLANIYGFGDVLSDRSIQIILQRSNKSQTRLIEDFATNPEVLGLKSSLANLKMDVPRSIFSKWNDFVQTKKVDSSLKSLFEKIHKTKLSGRPLEIFFPLFIVSNNFGFLDIFLETCLEYLESLEGDSLDNMDDVLQDFMEQNSFRFSGFQNISFLLAQFRKSLESPDDWINSRWFGRALKRLGLVSKKRLINGCVQVLLTKNSTTQNREIKRKMVEFVDNVEFGGEVGNILIKPEEFGK